MASGCLPFRTVLHLKLLGNDIGQVGMETSEAFWVEKEGDTDAQGFSVITVFLITQVPQSVDSWQ